MSDRLSQVLAHPLRDRVLFEYQGEAATPAQVARRVGRPVNLISYHTRVLAEHGCLVLVRTARRHGALEHYYRSAVAPWIADDDWDRVPAPLRRALVRGTLSKLDEEARAAAMTGGFDGPSVLVRALFELDEEGIAAVSDVLQAAFEEVERIAGASRGQDGLRQIEVALLEFPRDAPDQAQSRQTGSSPAS